MLQLEALQRIQVARVFDIYEMLRALQELRDRLSQQVGARVWAPLPPQCCKEGSRACVPDE